MDGNIIEPIRITHEDLVNQLVKQLTVMTFDLSVVRAENEKLKNQVAKLSANLSTNDSK